MSDKKALIAMSGGVDSSVAAKFMKDKGYECIGCTMKLYESGDSGGSRTCCSLDDVEDARSVAFRLGMPFYVFNFVDDFRDTVIRNFIESYRHGMTPNPCIECNRYMKFDKLLKRGQQLGCEYIVTGHYARIQERNGKYVLMKAVDKKKDQSYVLYNLTQEQLAHLLLPLGEMTKPEVREIAAQAGLVNAEKPDSQDICFVPDGDYAGAIEKMTGEPPVPGSFIDKDGNVLGQHKGIVHYTIGQRKGLGITFGEPMYVKQIDPKDNTVTLGRREELFSKRVYVGEFNWIAGEAPASEIRCKAKIRYAHQEQWAIVTATGPDAVRIDFDEQQRAATPGQAAVLYNGEVVLGGGTILRKED